MTEPLPSQIVMERQRERLRTEARIERDAKITALTAENARLAAELAEARDAAHYNKGTADLAMRHRDVAESALADRDATIVRLREALEPFGVVAQHWRAEAYMRDDADCPIAWASEVSARLLACMASELPRIKFEAFRRAARVLSETRAGEVTR